MRKLQYAVEGKAANLETFATDEPGHGGANHNYLIEKPGAVHVDIKFQNGAINVGGNGVNGVQNEDLLAIVIDRLKGFQRGPFAHQYNADALTSIRSALASLQQRTRDRIARGVEGTHTV